MSTSPPRPMPFPAAIAMLPPDAEDEEPADMAILPATVPVSLDPILRFIFPVLSEPAPVLS